MGGAVAGEAAEGDDEAGAGAGGAAGSVAGAVIGGAIAGPPGALIGGAIGAAGGAIAGAAGDDDDAAETSDIGSVETGGSVARSHDESTVEG